MNPLAVESEPSTVETIRSALRGDEEAFEEVIRLFSRQLYSVAFGIVQNGAEAEDIVQESFLAAHRHRWRLFNPEKFPAWLRCVARNKARDVWRKRVRQATDSLGESVGECLQDKSVEIASQGMEEVDQERIIRTLLASLPEQWRAAVTLRYLEGLDHAAIEQRMGISNGAVRGILGRAMARLRDQAASHQVDLRNSRN